MYGQPLLKFPIPVLPPPENILDQSMALLTMSRRLYWGPGCWDLYEATIGYYCEQCKTTFFGSEVADLRHACTEAKFPVWRPCDAVR